jgi:hypothetical protein
MTVLDAVGEGPDVKERRSIDQCRTVQTLWRLSQQFVPVSHRAPRGIRRDASRKLKRDISDVNVIVLRRERSVGEHEETDRHYSVTFLVRGHWSLRWCKKDPDQPPGGELVKRMVWVVPHLKGEGPFKETTRAWEFRR